MLLGEMVRLVSEEENYINVATEYSRNNVAWGTLHDYGNITVDEDGIVIFNFERKRSNLIDEGYIRLKVGGSLYVYGIRPTDTYVVDGCAVWLAAGTYNILFEGKTNGSASVYVKNFQCGFVSFADSDGNANQSYSSGLATTITARATPLGNIKNNILCINAFAYTSAAQTNFENVGGAETNGVSVLVDGVQQDWSERNQDADSYEAASAKCYVAVTAGEEHTVTISKDNGATVVHISVIACPWILPYESSEVVDLGSEAEPAFPQGSTLYVTTEPLFLNPTKNVQVGKVRAVSFGDTTDFYMNDSNVDILESNYTFDTISAVQSQFRVDGLGGCISFIGVDAR